jgi:hypothetical protein
VTDPSQREGVRTTREQRSAHGSTQVEENRTVNATQIKIKLKKRAIKRGKRRKRGKRG